MITVERSVAASPERVWQLLADLERWDKMLPTMQQVTRLGADRPVGVGSRFEVRQPGLPRAMYEVTRWDPGSGFTWRASTPGVRTTATHRLETQGETTRLLLGIEWSGPLAGVVGLLMRSKTERMVRQEADTFATLAESGAQPA